MLVHFHHQSWPSPASISHFFLKIHSFIHSFIHEKHTERGRDTGRGGNRLPAANPMWDLIQGPRDHNLSQRQMLNHWATQVPLSLFLYNSPVAGFFYFSSCPLSVSFQKCKEDQSFVCLNSLSNLSTPLGNGSPTLMCQEGFRTCLLPTFLAQLSLTLLYYSLLIYTPWALSYSVSDTHSCQDL